jgi:replicative DNA helicase
MDAQHYEAALIDACIHKGATAEVLSKVSASDFSLRFRPIFDVIASQFDRGMTPDIISVLEECETKDEAQELKDTFIDSFLALPGSIRDVDTHCKELKRLAIARKLKELAIKVNYWAAEEEPETAYEMASAAIMELRGDDNEDTTKGINEMLKESLEDLERRFESSEEFDGLATGFAELDARYNGMKKENLILIAGRPSHGKTTLALNIAENCVRQDKTVLFFNLEMSHKELTDKLISSSGNLSFTRISNANMRDEDWPKLVAGTSVLKNKPLFVDSRSSLSVAQMRGKAYQIKAKHGLNLIVVDYIQLMHSKGDSREREIGNISRGLKNLAKEMGCPVIAISQLNRQCESRPNKRPLPSDLRDSGSLEQDANIITFVYRDEVYDENSPLIGVAEIITRKIRGGKPGTDCLEWKGDHQAFRHLDHRPDVESIVEEAEAAPKRGKRTF